MWRPYSELARANRSKSRDRVSALTDTGKHLPLGLLFRVCIAASKRSPSANSTFTGSRPASGSYSLRANQTEHHHPLFTALLINTRLINTRQFTLMFTPRRSGVRVPSRPPFSPCSFQRRYLMWPSVKSRLFSSQEYSINSEPAGIRGKTLTFVHGFVKVLGSSTVTS